MKNEFVYLDLFLILNVSSEIKARRVLGVIVQRLNRKLNIMEIYKDGITEFIVVGHLDMNANSSENLITETLILLDKIGEHWIVKSPILNHQIYWKFTGERNLEQGTFKINGIKSISFDLTNYEKFRSIQEILE